MLVEGMAPLDVLVKRLQMNIGEFCDAVGIDDSTFRRWRQRGVANLNHVQAKKLDGMLRSVGLTIQDLPDNLSKYIPKNNAQDN